MRRQLLSSVSIEVQDLGGGYVTHRDPERAMNRIVCQTNTLGFTVHFDLIQAAYPPRSP